MNDATPPTPSPQTNPALVKLGAFVGTWVWDAIVEGQSIGRGPTEFSWLEGGAFLIEHAGSEAPDFPTGTTIYGADDESGEYAVFQVDSRGIARIYQMRLNDGVWKYWRNQPGFFQRYTGMFSQDGRTITGRVEQSADGVTWQTDFDLTYTRTG